MKNIVKNARANRRAKNICNLARAAFWSAVYGCEIVSSFNNRLAFVVKRKNSFGYPSIERITHPDVVYIGEFDNCVVVKDGFYYELDKRK